MQCLNKKKLAGAKAIPLVFILTTLASCGGGDIGSPPSSEVVSYQGTWSACYDNEESSGSELRTLVVNEDMTWQREHKYYTGADCNESPDAVIDSSEEYSGTYTFGDEVVLANGMTVREFNYRISASSDSFANIGRLCHSLIKAYGGILLLGEETALSDCEIPSTRPVVMDIDGPLFSDEKAMAAEHIAPLADGVFENCRNSGDESFYSTQSQFEGLWEGVSITYDGINCAGRVIEQTVYRGYYFVESLVSIDDGIEMYDVIWSINRPNQQSPVCFTREGYSLAAIYSWLVTEEGLQQDVNGCRYEQRDLLVLELTEPWFRQ